MSLIESLAWRAARHLRPPPRIPLSHYIEEKIRLPEGLTARPGKVRLWPFQREIADAIGDPEIERVTVQKPTRVGYSTLLMGAVGNYIENEPAPILFVLPTDDDCRDFVVSDMEPIFECSPSLNGVLAEAQDETGRNTIRHRRFPGGFLKVIAAKSPRKLRRHTSRILFVDEEDAIEETQEGDAIALAIQRTLTFPNRKIVRGSSPTDEDTTTICREYARSDRRVYEIKCVECGDYAEPQWEHLRWEKGRPETARWACPNCGALVEERYKVQMVADGRWRATRPEVEGHAGFRLSALISPHQNARWPKLIEEFEQAENDPALLKVFVNTALGRAWRDSIDQDLEPEKLHEACEAIGLNVALDTGEWLALPSAVLIITAGVDVQDDRAEVNVYGWSADGHMWALAHFVIWGSPEDDETWRELDSALKTKWQHPLGGQIGIDACCIDSGDGGWTDRVYAFCWPRTKSRRIFAIKGKSGFSRPPVVESQGKVAKGSIEAKGKLWIVGVDAIKNALMVRLSGDKRSTCHFSKSLSLTWFEQLLSEKRVVKKVMGRYVKRFERIPGRQAEALDATVYAIAARNLVTINLESRTSELATPPEVQKQVASQPQATTKGWLDDVGGNWL